jgi:hypothetical protein
MTREPTKSLEIPRIALSEPVLPLSRFPFRFRFPE